MEQAKSQLDRMYGTLTRLADITLEENEIQSSAAFMAAMDDDLNTPKAVAVLMEAVTLANRSEDLAERRRCKAELLAGGRELGILQQDPVAWAKGDAGADGADDAAIDALVAERVAARAAKDWKRADEVRDQLVALGIQIMDGANGTQWRRE